MTADTATVVLENGSKYRGRLRASPDGWADVGGEAVFFTGYTGYEECLTDPSYRGQALIFCYPHVGNYGLDERRFESDRVQPNAVLCRDTEPWVAEWLDDENVPLIDTLPTRSIVTEIRDEGSMVCGIGPTDLNARSSVHSVPSVSEITDMPDRVGVDSTRVYGDLSRPVIALLDCGVKWSMIERFLDRGATVVRLPNDARMRDVEAVDPDLLFVSNGPGDPQHYEQAIETVRRFSPRRVSLHSSQTPVAGICLGQQIVALAHNGSTEQMKFGHRGSNQPVKPDEGPVKMTTQNHSFEVSHPGLFLDVVEHNVNDGSAEGLRAYGIETRQYHPEANPGPNDSLDFFDQCMEMAERFK